MNIWDNSKKMDKKVLAYNLTESISEASKGSLAYVINPNHGGGGDRKEMLIRSRSGRWIRKWESAKRLENPRVKTIPPGHPLYSQPLWNAEWQH